MLILLQYTLAFLFFGVMGWLIDTTYRCITERRIYSGTLVPMFSIVYAVGGTFLFWLYSYLDISPFYEIILAVLFLVLLEFFSGALALFLFKRRLWDYGGNRLNIMGHIDLLHSIYWLILGGAVWITLLKLGMQ